MFEIKKEEFYSLLLGASFFSTGGGGNYDDGLKLLEEIESVNVLSIDEVDDYKFLFTLFFAGSIASPELEVLKREKEGVSIENEGELILNSYDTLNEKFGGELFYVVPVELGGHNTAPPLLLGAKRNIFVIDGDLTGRSAPEIAQTSLVAGGFSPFPAGVGTIFSERILIEGNWDYERFDKFLRYLVEYSYGYDVGVSSFPLKVKSAKNFVIKGTIRKSLEVGKLLLKGKILEAMRLSSSEILYEGVVMEEVKFNKDGFSYGRVKIKSDKGILRIFYKNEIIFVFLDDELIGEPPECFGVIDEEGKPVLNGRFKEGERVAVYKFRTPEIWLKGKGKEVFSKKWFEELLSYFEDN